MKRVLIISRGIIATIWASGAFAQTMPTATAEAPSSDVPQGGRPEGNRRDRHPPGFERGYVTADAATRGWRRRCTMT
jgi:hypothetical protein